MDLFGVVDLVGRAAKALLGRPRFAIPPVIEDYDMFGDQRVKRFFFPVESPEMLTELADEGPSTVYSKPYEWVAQNGGYELGHTVFEFTIQALNATVALIGGKPIVHRGLVETPGIAVLPPPAGGPIEGSYLSVSLDGETLTCHDGDNPGAPIVSFRYEILQGTTEIFRVHAYTTEAVSWYLRLLLVVNGKRVEYDIERANGEEFVTYPHDYSGITASYRWEHGHWEQVQH